MPAAAFQLHALLHQVPLATQAWFLIVHFNHDFPSSALLKHTRQKFKVQPQVCLRHIEVLVAFIGDDEEKTGL